MSVLKGKDPAAEGGGGLDPGLGGQQRSLKALNAQHVRVEGSDLMRATRF